MKSVNFVVNGEPMSKQRPKISTFGGFAKAYTPKETLNYENKVLMCYKQEIKDTEYQDKLMFDNGEFVKLTIYANFGLTKADYGKKGLNKSGRTKIENKWCDKHKDLDNIIKIVLDALNGVCYKDDKQIVCIESYKLYTQDQPNVKVKFETMV